jgi:uncharacterized delta-60 repeat protein
VAIQPDGKIVSVGVVTAKGTDYQEICIVRLNPNGTLDTTFNNTGIVDLKVGAYADASALAIQPDGKILVGGTSNPTVQGTRNFSPNTELVLARYNTNGTLDTTFANKGILIWDRTSGEDGIGTLAVLANGNIVATVNANTLCEFTPSGKLVTTFGSGGVATFQPVTGTNLSDFVVAPNGDLIVSGYGGNTSWNGVGLLFAVNPTTGALDPSFNNGQGWLSVANPAGGIYDFYSVTVQGSNIVVGGDSQIPNQGRYGLLARFTLTGSLDTSFANGGYFVMPTTGGFFDNLAVETDGSLIAEGPVENGYLTVAHFTANGQLDTTFGGAGTGFAVISGAEGFGLAIQTDGKIVVSGHDGPAVNGQRMAFFARLTPPGP